MTSTEQTLVIAEAGVNHNGDLKLAKKLVDAAVESGADVVKFQTFQANHLATENAEQASYQMQALGESQGQLAMLQKLQLSPEHHTELINYCKYRDIEFLSTAFDMPSIHLLASLGLRRWKIPSGEITNLPYLRQIGSYNQSVILSTGMATLGEIEDALYALNLAGTSSSQITVLHCTTEYPSPPHEVNLRAINTIAQAFGVAVGYSDHTQGISVPIAAVAMGAKVIEKHLTLDCNLPGPDHRASIEPHQFSAMVAGIRTIEQALGDGIKRPTPSEIKNIPAARKSLVASTSIQVGEPFSLNNLTAKRPGTGISPMRIDELIGCPAMKEYRQDEAIVYNRADSINPT